MSESQIYVLLLIELSPSNTNEASLRNLLHHTFPLHDCNVSTEHKDLQTEHKIFLVHILICFLSFIQLNLLNSICSPITDPKEFTYTIYICIILRNMHCPCTNQAYFHSTHLKTLQLLTHFNKRKPYSSVQGTISVGVY